MKSGLLMAAMIGLISFGSTALAGKTETAKKEEPRAPASVQCEMLFRSCVSETDLKKQAGYCAAAVGACQARFTDADRADYDQLSVKCNNIEKTRTTLAKPAADFCRATLTQYILSN